MMGWSSYKAFGLEISKDIILEQARIMATNGFKQAGYVYVNIDDGFMRGHDQNGAIVWNEKTFPEGIKDTVDELHALGFKAGMYSPSGFDPKYLWDGASEWVADGFYGHEDSDSKFFFNDIGFDFLKINGFFPVRLRSVDHRALFTKISEALKRTGRDVRLNLCTQAFPGAWASQISESWRTGDDVSPNWWSVNKTLMECRYLSAYASPGHYNDMDILVLGRVRKPNAFDDKTAFSEEEEQSYFGMWCMLSSPLVLGKDLRQLPESTLKLMTNPYLLHMNQNEGLGLQGYIVRSEGGAYTFVKDADVKFGNSRYVALYNGTDGEQEFRLHPGELDLNGKIQMFDLVERADYGLLTDGWSVRVPPHGTKFYRLDAEERLERTLYDAETAFLSDFQTVRNGWESGTAYPVEGPYAEKASGGMIVRYLGRRDTNDLIWKDVMIKKGGKRKLAITGCAYRSGDIYLQVDRGPKMKIRFNSDREHYQTHEVEVELSAGLHEVRLFNAYDWCPDIDKMEIR